MINLLELSTDQISKIDFQCSCGHHHEVSIEDIRIGQGVIGDTAEILSGLKGQRVLLVADKNTYTIAGQAVEDILSNDFELVTFVYEDEYLIADAKSLGKILLEMNQEVSLILTLGSGTLNDITRYISAKTRIPYGIIATAPSMDGYASIVSPLIRNGVKTTFNGVYPITIIGDTEIMKDAPMHMIQAGLGDVLGKYTGLADWRMSKVMGLERGEYYCDNIAALVESAVEKCVDVAPDLASRAGGTIEAIMEGLILSGLCIGLAGHSRPASGSEHQISHYIEMKFLQEGVHTKWLHGNKVGVATLAVIEAYDYLFSKDIEDIYSTGKYKKFHHGQWIERVNRCFGDMSQQIIKLKEKELLIDEKKRQDRMDHIVKKWDDMKNNCYLTLPKPSELKSILEETGSIYNPKDLGVDRQLFKDSLMVAKEIRNRYGIMELLDNLGMLEEVAEHITCKYYGN
ncbi:MAG TPA: sn-glycerol-1-phosphate dehydrogenase [Clostridia bacterium]|nr:sn-glycerol-1-phosphate dehydrogenase [Clostridia bacterium]